MDGNREGFVEARNRKNRNGNNDGSNKQNASGSPSHEKSWKLSKEKVEEMKRSANKYAVLSEEESEVQEMDAFIDNRLIVDEFIKKKMQPSVSETKGWTDDMIKYFKYAWEAMERKEKEVSDDEDVLENLNQVMDSLIADEVLGTDGGGMNL
ncbi:hypothetical protein Tco_1573696 [Tanacetum coccineum]